MALCATFLNYSALAQMTITNGGKVTLNSGGLVKVDGKLEIQSGGELETAENEVNLSGDLIQNGTLTHTAGKIQFTGDGTQTISGDVIGDNGINVLVIPLLKHQTVSKKPFDKIDTI